MAVSSSPQPTVLLPASDIERINAELARKIAPVIDDETIAAVLLTGGLWFGSDLTRALYREGRNVKFDAVWMSSYGDDKMSRGKVTVRAPFQRSMEGKTVLLVDDVLDSGLSLIEAVRITKEAGAARVLTCVFARKPCAHERIEPDFVGWEAPARFLVGYGLDHQGGMRGLPDICALD